MAGLIGVFGGTFDPPHLGHTILAHESVHAFDLEKVLWVLTEMPPHKPDHPITPLGIREEMLQVAIQGFPAFELSRVDIDRPGPHFAEGTLRCLRESAPETRYAYLMGEDSLRDLPTWHAPLEFIALCDMLVVMHRADIGVDLGALEEVLPGIRDKVQFSKAPKVDIAASDIRKRVRNDLPYEHLVHHEVARIIRRHQLYR
ncbi:MAG TPA: nicotinate (nicotinamide) nucleotide adenylyltransferase [Anaerolineae bacterium]|nr:nicotinate (nicotinamide) nucleotide adenylyltransferase [Anaerolineae bacterium]